MNSLQAVFGTVHNRKDEFKGEKMVRKDTRKDIRKDILTFGKTKCLVRKDIWKDKIQCNNIRYNKEMGMKKTKKWLFLLYL